MTAEYRIDIHDTQGARLGTITDYVSLYIVHSLNNFSTCTLTVSDNDDVRSWFTLDAIVRVMRRDRVSNIPWYQEYVGLHRTPQRIVSVDGRRNFTSYSRGLLDLIHRREIRYKTGTPGARKSGPAGQIIQAYVNENAGPGATVPLRFSNGVTPNLVVPVTTVSGTAWEGNRSYQNLLEVIQEIAESANIHFNVVMLSLSPLQFEFRVLNQMDRTATIIFSTDFANMVSPSRTVSRTEEVTSVAVLGQGQEEFRTVTVRTSPSAADSPWNTVESSRDARQETTTNALNNVGDAALSELGLKDKLDFRVLQTTGIQYARDYFLGDKVTARFYDILRTPTITGVVLHSSSEQGGDSVDIEIEA